ncbi:hypothetical protein Pmani_003320 [Petrolisthes manimaculis]|uniref:EF-hand domain-containing protein n=1 Tax=Petrolisthes manimaculis TaxID=1843537 RepID=A0AAE1UQ45_9EUCA|nr:hypothetical protein Pmani_003320 [Petrolisthes manimaculis]
MDNNHQVSTTRRSSLGGVSATSQLQALFNTCDKQGKGYIVQEELRELCASLAIAAEDSDVIFTDLDQDEDGKISYDEFSRGFTEFLNPECDVQATRRFSVCKDTRETTAMLTEDGGDGGGVGVVVMVEDEEAERRRRESVYQAWNNLTQNLTELSKAPLRPESCALIRDLLQDLETSSSPGDVAGRVSSVLSSLVQDIHNLHSHHHNLEKLYKKEKEHHVSALKSLEEELEDQVAKVEQKAKQKARQESEEEKRQLQDQMEEEMAELQTHLKIFQKVDSWLRREDGEGGEKVEEVRRKLEEAYHANRSLHMNLSETTTNLGLMRTDLAQTRLQYEEKCRELHNERENVLEYMHQYDHMKRQLQLLHDANKRLQDTNDSMREVMEGERRQSPLGSRASSTRSSSLHRHRDAVRSHSRSRSPQVPVFSSLDSDGGLNYGIRRLMDDLDSGLSTLPDAHQDPTTHPNDDFKLSEHDGPMSLEEELLSLESHSPPETTERSHNTPGLTPSPPHPQTSTTPPPHHHAHTPPPILEISTPKLKPRRVTQLSNDGENGTSPGQGKAETLRSSGHEFLGPPERTYKVVFAGDAAVGKSTFIVRLCKGCFVTNIASTLEKEEEEEEEGTRRGGGGQEEEEEGKKKRRRRTRYKEKVGQEEAKGM